MKKRKTIQKFLALCLLLFFGISVTPKIYFHDVIAQHKDVISSCDHARESKACLHQKGFDCHADNLVVTAPYLVFPVVHSSVFHPFFADVNTFYYSSSSQDCLIHKESRGPPQA